MSIPGLGLSASVARTQLGPIDIIETIAVHELSRNSEWRFEVAISQSIELKVLSGTAELFGTELALNHPYTFRGTKAAIYSWHGCRLEVKGLCTEYIAEETPMISYVNAHFALEKSRDDAQESGGEGPRVLVLGPSNSGKTSLVKLLTAYAVRMGRQPMIINTDSREGLLSIPGILTATPFASTLDVEEGWGSSPSSGPSPVPVKSPLCYYYGLENPEDNTRLWKPTVSRLAITATSRLVDDPDVKFTGMIIDTPGSITSGKYSFDLISHIVKEFQVNTILILGSERLEKEMTRQLQAYKTVRGEEVTVLKLDKSGGCVDRDETFMRATRDIAIKEYFFGTPSHTLSPQTRQISFSDLTIYRITSPTTISSNFLPGLGEEETSFSCNIYEKTSAIDFGEMLHSVLAVAYARRGDAQETVRDAPVMGFVYVAEVDARREKVSLLAPSSEDIGERPLVWGCWPEAVLNLMG
ncbi:Pre-mRNA cleavage complex II protein Clp1-domain-containing protein [Calycina marina]|uniref:Polynucleotide 5'-hydroxyl-kinase GRC3 n=1 Tax=Calycina marina TaxID=1763456 RepID=A0A9P7Z2G3_9HELO|nr:Pre-mRNA cleavage complex II protein Clp1-domain-containing protein [Calycina marina]